jgi:RNA recognition motif-containing protein
LKKIFVGNLPENATEKVLTELFAEFGTVRSVHLVQDIFSGRCKGFGFIEMEGHEARAAIAGCDGKMYEGKQLKVKFEDDRGKVKGKRRR